MRTLVRVLVVSALVMGVAGCAASVGAQPGLDAGTYGCTEDVDCPPSESCRNGVCVATNPVDAAADAGAPQRMTVDPKVLDFGSPYLGSEYTRSFTITNVGGSPLAITSLTLIEDSPPGAFSLQTPGTSLTIAPGDAVTVVVVLRPNSDALPMGSVKVHSDDPDSGSADATVDLVSHRKGAASLGVCVANPAPPPPCLLGSDSHPLLDFGTVAYGASATRIVALTNVGDGNLPFPVTDVALTNPAHFTVALFALVDDPAHPGQRIESPATLPYLLAIGDPTAVPPVPPSELRVHVTFTADGVQQVPDESLVVKYGLPDSPTSIPIAGSIAGCMVSDGGVPDGGVDTQTDPNHCGSCGHVCQVPHATAACVASACTVGQCSAGWGDCDSDHATNGCEQSLDTLQHCAACNTPCARANATASCAGGACHLESCSAGYANCDSNEVNGCEVTNTGYSNGPPGDSLGQFNADAASGYPLCGSVGCDLAVQRTGTRGAYFQARAIEDSYCTAYVALKFVLTVPAGVNYDLVVSGGCLCDPASCSSQLGAGQTETVTVWCNDDGSGGDNSFTANAEVRFLQGQSCNPWTLNVYAGGC